MQQFFGLTVTGKPNEETLEMMQKPRCGVPDTGEFMLTPGYPRWKHTNLTYRCYSRGFKTYSCILLLLSMYSVAGTVLGLEIHQRQANKYRCPCRVLDANEWVWKGKDLFIPKPVICYFLLIIERGLCQCQCLRTHFRILKKKKRLNHCWRETGPTFHSYNNNNNDNTQYLFNATIFQKLN